MVRIWISTFEGIVKSYCGCLFLTACFLASPLCFSHPDANNKPKNNASNPLVAQNIRQENAAVKPGNSASQNFPHVTIDIVYAKYPKIFNEEQCRAVFVPEALNGSLHSKLGSRIDYHHRPPADNGVIFGKQMQRFVYPDIVSLYPAQKFKLSILATSVSYGPGASRALFVKAPFKAGGIYLSTAFCDVVYTFDE